MANLKDIRARISSTQNTQKITKAMKLVSAAKLRRAQHDIVNMRPYAQKIMSVIANIASSGRVDHPLLHVQEKAKKVLLVVLTSDRGLCGGFNANIIKFAEKYYQEHSPDLDICDFLMIGRKGADYFRNHGYQPKDTITALDRNVSHELAADVAENLMNSYLEGQYEEIRLIYNEFKSPIEQKVTCERLLPIDVEAHSTFEEDTQTVSFAKDLIFEPTPELIIEDLVRKHFSVQVYRCMAESVAAEHGARMTAMENATKNAGELIDSMTLTYNKLRQASITTELIEITSGAEALNG